MPFTTLISFWDGFVIDSLSLSSISFQQRAHFAVLLFWRSQRLTSTQCLSSLIGCCRTIKTLEPNDERGVRTKDQEEKHACRCIQMGTCGPGSIGSRNESRHNRLYRWPKEKSPLLPNSSSRLSFLVIKSTVHCQATYCWIHTRADIDSRPRHWQLTASQIKYFPFLSLYCPVHTSTT